MWTSKIQLVYPRSVRTCVYARLFRRSYLVVFDDCHLLVIILQLFKRHGHDLRYEIWIHFCEKRSKVILRVYKNKCVYQMFWIESTFMQNASRSMSHLAEQQIQGLQRPWIGVSWRRGGGLRKCQTALLKTEQG